MPRYDISFIGKDHPWRRFLAPQLKGSGRRVDNNASNLFSSKPHGSHSTRPVSAFFWRCCWSTFGVSYYERAERKKPFLLLILKCQKSKLSLRRGDTGSGDCRSNYCITMLPISMSSNTEKCRLQSRPRIPVKLIHKRVTGAEADLISLPVLKCYLGECWL